MYKKPFIMLSLSAGLLLSLPALADTYYKWVDDENVTHYEKHPPKDRESTKVTTSGSRSAPPPAAKSSKSADDLASNSSVIGQGKPVKDKSICEKARNNLKAMKAHARVHQRDEYGEQRLLSEQEKEAEMNRARAAIKQNC